MSAYWAFRYDGIVSVLRTVIHTFGFRRFDQRMTLAACPSTFLFPLRNNTLLDYFHRQISGFARHATRSVITPIMTCIAFRTSSVSLVPVVSGNAKYAFQKLTKCSTASFSFGVKDTASFFSLNAPFSSSIDIAPDSSVRNRSCEMQSCSMTLLQSRFSRFSSNQAFTLLSSTGREANALRCSSFMIIV